MEEGLQGASMRESVIVVLHYENDALTNQCVESILKTTDWHKVQILVVDNFSPKPYEDHTGKVMVMRNETRDVVNGMNFGFYHALFSMNFKPKYIVNMDNDVICLDGWYEPLVKAMEEDEKIGIAGGKQWDKEQKYYRGVGSDMIGGMLYVNHPKEKEEVFYLQGSCVIMRADMMRKIGLHDDRFKTVCSDSDYCFHAKDRGWKVMFIPESNIIHIQNASITSVADSWFNDNRELLRKWSGSSAMCWLGSFPLDGRDNRYLRVKYEIIKDESKDPLVQEMKIG